MRQDRSLQGKLWLSRKLASSAGKFGFSYAVFDLQACDEHGTFRKEGRGAVCRMYHDPSSFYLGFSFPLYSTLLCM